MKLTISYAELQEYVASHFHKTVNVGHVDGKTVSVSLPIKVLAFTKSVSINVGVEKIEGTDLYLSYDGKMGIDLLVSRLGDLDKLQKVFEKVVLRAIRFAPESIEAEIALL